MRLGMNIPREHADGRPYSAADVMARARAIEAAGFDGIWMGESMNRGRPSVDTLAVLAVAAAATSRVEIGTAVLQVPLRPPAELALRLLTLHALSGGRFVAGLGAGSTKLDFDACGIDYENRFKLFAAALPQVRRLCNGEQVGAANFRPWPPLAGGPPLLIGAWVSGIWVKRAAQDYDGWISSGRANNQFRTLAEGLKVYRDHGGKRALIATVGIDLTAPNKSLADDEPFNLRCGPQEAAARLQQLAELGIDDVLLVMGPQQSAEALPAIRALLKQHAPAH
ncbi:MAG: LLM class flavin-dependent oxidoreductase [Betaproteobacteria bacterium]|nr:LLM class flavin-dependent oxidoreductase [Betaproteobacteria bacterium]